MMETQINTGETQRRPKRRPRKLPSRTMAALRLTREQYAAMRARAVEEGLPFATWLKRAALKELRRKVAL
jgi:predicted DNA binding CopG/RHH family protein